MESLKKRIIQNVYVMPLIEEFQNQKLSIVTPAGIITGSPIAKDESIDSNKVFAEFISHVSTSYREDYSIDSEKPLDGSDGCFTIKNAKLVSGNITYNFQTLSIFYDQIIAITCGEIS